MQMNQTMYTVPRTCNSKSLRTRVYVTFYFNNQRVREYSGKCIGLKLFPGKARTIAERTKLLNLLCKEIAAALVNGTYKVQPENITTEETFQETWAAALNKKLSSALSNTYKRDLRYIHDQFIGFLSEKEKRGTISQISTQRVELFLEQFNSSNAYYMNKRTDLAALFTAAGRTLNLQLGAVCATQRKKVATKLNVAYDPVQVKPLLDFLEQKHTKLFICCMLTYSTWLRPHVEIRNLTRSHFSDNYSRITLAGKDNKSRRVRVVYVPPYAQDALRSILDGLEPEQNIFSGQSAPLNPDYFKTCWNRLRQGMLEQQLIREDQTIYSFRHSAAVQFYRKNKDICLLRQVFGHQSVVVTQKYLRSLAEVDMEVLMGAAPEL